MASSSRVGSNTAWLGGKVLLASGFGLLQMKIFTSVLSLEEMGLLQVMRGLVSLLVALGLLGLPTLVMRFLPQLETRGEGRRIFRIAVLVLGALLLSLGLVCILAWNLRHFLAGRFAFAADDRLLPMALLLVMAMGLTELAFSLYQGIRRMGPMALAEIIGAGLLTLHLWWRRETLDPATALWLLALYWLLRGGALLLLFPRFLDMPRSDALPLRIARRDLLDYWGLSLVLRWLALAYLDLDRYVIGMVATLDIVSLFHVPARLVGLSRGLLAAPTLSLQTEVSRLYEERRDGALPSRLQLFLRGQVLVSLWLAAALFLLARPLILLSSTSAYLAALPLLLVLLAILPLSSLAAPLEAAFRGLDGMKVVLLGNLIWALFYFGSLSWLVRCCGLLGLGLAQLLGAGLQVLWILLAARRRGWLRGLGAPLARSLSWGVLPPAAAILLALLLPGASGPSPGPAGILAGMALLLLGVAALLRSEKLFQLVEKRWLLAQLPFRSLRRGLARALNTGEAQP